MAGTPSNPQPPPNANTQIRVRAQRRQDGVASVIYTPDLISVVDSGPAPYSIVMTGSGGVIDASLLPSNIGSTVYVNGVLVANPDFNDSTPSAPGGFTNVRWQKDANGHVSAYYSTSGIMASFGDITTGDNTAATMTVDTGASLSYTGSGVVNASEIGTINVTGNLPAHEGQLLISQPGNTTAVWADPLVQGLYPDGTRSRRRSTRCTSAEWGRTGTCTG